MSFKNLTESALSICMNVFNEETLVAYKRDAQTYLISGILETGFVEEDPNVDRPIGSTRAVLNVQASKMPIAPKKKDRVEVNSKTYRVFDIEPDTFGGIKLILEVVKA
jgi:hypothetical protein